MKVLVTGSAEFVSEKLNLGKRLLKPVSMSEMTWKAKKPKDSSLDVSKASSILHNKPQKINQSLDGFLKEIKIK